MDGWVILRSGLGFKAGWILLSGRNFFLTLGVRGFGICPESPLPEIHHLCSITQRLFQRKNYPNSKKNQHWGWILVPRDAGDSDSLRKESTKSWEASPSPVPCTPQVMLPHIHLSYRLLLTSESLRNPQHNSYFTHQAREKKLPPKKLWSCRLSL